ncbi:annexin A1-like isoform X2 [Hyla sarda]|uniref:annexin A1-like isoform X2 n=1 Tax=Hyla sarda TaxID=327740 RepID=UPI0024C2AF3A|nr:annexin A1-like isoform X2 [Hyla sarda]
MYIILEATEVQGGSDLKPHTKYNPAEDVAALQKSLTGKDIDKVNIINIISSRTNEQRQEMKAAYKEKTGESLEDALKKAFSGKLEKFLQDMMKTPAEFDAAELKAATKGAGTTEDTLIEILATRTNQDIKKMKEVYKTVYKTDVETDITEDTSGDFQKALLVLLKGERSEDCYVNEDEAEKDAKALFEAGENKKKADVDVFITIFTSRSYAHLNKVFQNYSKLSKHDVNKALDLKLKGDIESCLVAIAKVAESKPRYFAEKLHHATKGLGTRNKVVNRIMISRQEIDMKAIKAQFKEITGKSLRDVLMEETSGDYETALVALSGYDE